MPEATLEEKIRVLEASIHDAEWRIGSYIAGTTATREDPYVQAQIRRIYNWSEALDTLLIAQTKAP